MEEAGLNVLARDSRGGVLRILLRQLNDPLMYVLLVFALLDGLIVAQTIHYIVDRSTSGGG